LPVDPDALYTVATNDFMRRGGDGYVVFRDRAVDPYDFGPGLDDALASYIRANSPVRIAVDGRIVNR
jgi:5'-nucleotidase